MAKFAAAKTHKGQNVGQEGLDQGLNPTSHGTGMYHELMHPAGHDSEYAHSSGSIKNPVQHKFPANKAHGGKTVAKRKGNHGL